MNRLSHNTATDGSLQYKHAKNVNYDPRVIILSVAFNHYIFVVEIYNILAT